MLARFVGFANSPGGGNRRHGTYMGCMNYLLALFLPPLSIFLTGRIILALITLVIWIPAVIFSGGLTHPMFILLAWILIYERRNSVRG